MKNINLKKNHTSCKQSNFKKNIIEGWLVFLRTKNNNSMLKKRFKTRVIISQAVFIFNLSKI